MSWHDKIIKRAALIKDGAKSPLGEHFAKVIQRKVFILGNYKLFVDVSFITERIIV